MNICTLPRLLLVTALLFSGASSLAATPDTAGAENLRTACQHAESVGQMMEQQHQAYPLALDQILQLNRLPLDVDASVQQQLQQTLIEHIYHEPIIGIGDSTALQQRMQETGHWAVEQCISLLEEARQFDTAIPARQTAAARTAR